MAKISHDSLVNNEHREKIWSIVSEEYQNKKKEFEDEWNPKRKTLIILLLLFIIPGFIYYVSVYESREARNRKIATANSTVFNAIPLVANANDYVSKIETFTLEEPKIKKVNMPVKTSIFSSFFGSSNIGFFKESYAEELLKNDQEHKSASLLSLMTSTNILPELLGYKNGAGLFAPNTHANAISRELTVKSNVSLNAHISDGTVVSLSNVYLEYKEVVVVVNHKGQRRRVTYHVPMFAGTIVAFPLEAKYEHPFTVKTKDFSSRRSLLFKQEKRKLEYEFETDSFHDKFELLVAHEDGVAIRSQFSINSLGSFIKLADDSLPFVFSSEGRGSGSAFAFDNLKRNPKDIPFNIENPRRFFSDVRYAKQTLAEDFTILNTIFNTIYELRRTKFFVE